MNKLLKYVQMYKKEILIGVGVATGSMILYQIFGAKSIVRTKNTTYVIKRHDDLPIPKLNFGAITSMWKSGNHLDLILEDLTVNDLGFLGDELVSAIPEISKESEISIIMGVLQEK